MPHRIHLAPGRHLGTLLRHGLRAFGAALLAADCPCCGCEMGWGLHGVCEACWAELLPANAPACPLCGGPPGPEPPGEACPRCLAGGEDPSGAPFHAVVAWGHYDGRLRELIHALKYGGRPGLAEPLAVRLAEALVARAGPERLTGAALVPVPLARARRVRRGYDQALLLARGVGRAMRSAGLGPAPVVRALRRLREGRPQAGLSRTERLINPRGAYGPSRRARRLEGARVVLVDDVLTTGATAGECARVLLEAGAAEILVAVAARTPLKGSRARERSTPGGRREIE